MSKYIQISTTASSKKEAQKIAKALLGKKLAACAQIIGPVESIYKWHGKTEKAKEYLLLIKSRIDRGDAIIMQIKSLNSYEIPEIIVTEIIDGSRDYLKWISNSLK